MLTKICLFLAILASAGTLALTHLKVEEKIKGLEAKVLESDTKANTLQTEKTALSGQLSKAKTVSDELSNKLAAATKEAEASASSAADAKKETDKAKEELDKAKIAIEDAKKAAADLIALGKTADEIKAAYEKLGKTTTALDASTKEGKILAADLKKVSAELKAIRELDLQGPAMPGLKGLVMSVDPKWGFVVIDAGGERGALANGELKVNRGGQLVARLRISKVEKNHSIANIIQGSLKGDVLEGDQVIY